MKGSSYFVLLQSMSLNKVVPLNALFIIDLTALPNTKIISKDPKYQNVSFWIKNEILV